jgi:hypothetical protein
MRLVVESERAQQAQHFDAFWCYLVATKMSAKCSAMFQYFFCFRRSSPPLQSSVHVTYSPFAIRAN